MNERSIYNLEITAVKVYQYFLSSRGIRFENAKKCIFFHFFDFLGTFFSKNSYTNLFFLYFFFTVWSFINNLTAKS